MFHESYCAHLDVGCGVQENMPGVGDKFVVVVLYMTDSRFVFLRVDRLLRIEGCGQATGGVPTRRSQMYIHMFLFKSLSPRLLISQIFQPPHDRCRYMQNLCCFQSQSQISPERVGFYE